MSNAAVQATASRKFGGARINFWLVLLVVSLLVFAANTAVSTWQASRLAGGSTAAADLQVLSQQLVNQGRDAVGGNAEAFDAFRVTHARIERSVADLQARFGGEASVSAAVSRLAAIWAPLGKSATRLEQGRLAVTGLAEHADRFGAQVADLQARLDALVRALAVARAPAPQVGAALQQVVLAGTLTRELAEMRAGGPGAVAASEAFGRDALAFSQALSVLRNGNPDQGLTAVRNPGALAALVQVQQQWQQMKPELDAVVAGASQLFAAQSAVSALNAGADQMLQASRTLFDGFSALGSTRNSQLFPNLWLGVASGALLLLSLVGFIWGSVRTRTREQDARYQLQLESNSRNQQAIMRLLDEISSLGEGDLTVKASVTEDITGAIADAINYAVDELRNLVATINDTAVRVAAATQQTQATATELAQASDHQAREISSASDRINQIAGSIEQVSKNSSESADVAQKSVQIAAEGASVVRQTIQGMDQIRDQIQETSKRIKRLGESSQEIGSIVELINDISEQTNILALNAAVQAASAGEAGRGFAVVADEVQRLAERTSGATKRIEGLVQAIQADTNEAVSSMEQTTAEVVSGARLAEDAGTALGEIERVSNALNTLIHAISVAAGQQSEAATDITRTMDVIRQITTRTSQGAGQTAESIGRLAELAAELRRSVADFKLPA